MPYSTDPHGYGKPLAEDDILTPEEQAALDAMNAVIVSGAGLGAAPIPPPDTSMYVAPTESQYQVGGENYVAPYDPGAQYGMGAASDPAVTYAQNQPTDPYNTAPSGTYPSDPIPAPANTASDPYPASGYYNDSGAYVPLANGQGNRTYTALGQLGDTSFRPAPSSAPPNPLGSGNILATDPNEGALFWDDILHPQLPKPEPYPNKDGRMVLGAGDAMFIPGPVGGAAAGQAANLIDDAARVGANVADDAERVIRVVRRGGTVTDDAARAGATLDDAKAIPDPPRVTMPRNDGTPLTPEQSAANRAAINEFNATRAAGSVADDAARAAGSVADDAARAAGSVADDAARAGATLDDAKAIPEPSADTTYTAGTSSRRAGSGQPSNAGTTTPPASVPSRARSLLRPSKRGVALAAGGFVGGGILANNLQQPGDNPGDAARPGGPSGNERKPLEPGVYNPSTNPQSGAEWEGASTRSLELMKSYSPADWTAGTRRAPVEIDGVPRKLIESTAQPGLYVGYVDAAGNVVPVGNDVPAETFLELVVANAAEAPPGWGDVPAPSASTPTTPSSGEAVPAPASSGQQTIEDVIYTGDIRSSGGLSSWNDSWSSGSRSRSDGRSSPWDDFNEGFDSGREFVAADFMDIANGDYRRAEMMARLANRRRKQGKGRASSGTGGGFWPGFPWNRPPSPIRQHVLNAIEQSLARSRSQ